MDYIAEKTEFIDNNIPLVKTETPVRGYDGQNIGPANAQAQELANRTAWLKQGVESVKTSLHTLTDDVEKQRLALTETNKTLSNVADDLKTTRTTLSTVSENVTTVNRSSVSRDEELTSALKEQGSNLNQALATLDKREADNTTLLSNQAKNLESKLTETRGDVDTHTQELANLMTSLEAKQDTLVSGSNINTVFGVALTDVKEGGVTLQDATDFTDVLKSHIAVSGGLTLEQSEDGQTLTFSSATSESSDGLTVYTLTDTGYANSDTEIRTPRRPGPDTLAYVLRKVNIPNQNNRYFPLPTNPSDGYSGPYAGPGTNRIAILPDTRKVRWSTLDDITVDAKTYPNTKMAFSADGKDWYSLSSDGKSLVSLGQLNRDVMSADRLMDKGVNLPGFNAGNKAPLSDYLATFPTPPYLYLAFASTVNSSTHVFVPSGINVSFKNSSGWVKQPESVVKITYTPDSIIFTPTETATYAFCCAFMNAKPLG